MEFFFFSCIYLNPASGRETKTPRALGGYNSLQPRQRTNPPFTAALISALAPQTNEQEVLCMKEVFWNDEIRTTGPGAGGGRRRPKRREERPERRADSPGETRPGAEGDGGPQKKQRYGLPLRRALGTKKGQPELNPTSLYPKGVLMHQYMYSTLSILSICFFIL